MSLIFQFDFAVRYVVRLLDGITVAKTPEHGVEFYVKDGTLVSLFLCSRIDKLVLSSIN